MSDTDTDTDERPLTPDARAERECRGTPVDTPAGTWLLSDSVQGLGPVWDRLYDQCLLEPRYDPDDLRKAGYRLLLANYDVTEEEVVALVCCVPLHQLVVAVEAALAGPERTHRTYSDWVYASLYSNGINPATVPPEQLRNVLDVLVATNRAVPAHEFISSAQAAALRASLGVG